VVKNLRNCGLCGEKIKEGKYFTDYQCKGTECIFVLIVYEKDFKDGRYRETIMKISSI
jgi:hypothetical protein